MGIGYGFQVYKLGVGMGGCIRRRFWMWVLGEVVMYWCTLSFCRCESLYSILIAWPCSY